MVYVTNDDLEPSPWGNGYQEAFNNFNQALPLVFNASPFQRSEFPANEMYDDYEENKSVWSEDFDGRSRFTSIRDESVSEFGSESYAPSRNMFQNTDKRGLMEKEALAGEIQEGETSEVLKESSARRRWVALCWMLTFWLLTPLLTYVGRMKRMDVQRAWRGKLALNLLIWFICACAFFVIGVLRVVICPTECVFCTPFSTSELASHPSILSPNIVGREVFDFTTVAATHQRVVGVVPTKAILKYGGQSANNTFQFRYVFL